MSMEKNWINPEDFVPVEDVKSEDGKPIDVSSEVVKQKKSSEQLLSEILGGKIYKFQRDFLVFKAGDEIKTRKTNGILEVKKAENGKPIKGEKWQEITEEKIKEFAESTTIMSETAVEVKEERQPEKPEEEIKTEPKPTTEQAPDLNAQGQGAKEPLKPEEDEPKTKKLDEQRAEEISGIREAVENLKNTYEKRGEMIAEYKNKREKKEYKNKKEIAEASAEIGKLNYSIRSLLYKEIEPKAEIIENLPEEDRKFLHYLQGENKDGKFDYGAIVFDKEASEKKTAEELAYNIVDKFKDRGRYLYHLSMFKDIEDGKKDEVKNEIEAAQAKINNINSEIIELCDEINKAGIDKLPEIERKQIEEINGTVKRFKESFGYFSGVDLADLVNYVIEKEGGFEPSLILKKKEKIKPAIELGGEVQEPKPEGAPDEYGFKEGDAVVVVRTDSAIDLSGWFIHEIHSDGKVMVIKPDGKNWKKDLFKTVDAKELKSWQEKYKDKQKIEKSDYQQPTPEGAPKIKDREELAKMNERGLIREIITVDEWLKEMRDKKTTIDEKVNIKEREKYLELLVDAREFIEIPNIKEEIDKLKKEEEKLAGKAKTVLSEYNKELARKYNKGDKTLTPDQIKTAEAVNLLRAEIDENITDLSRMKVLALSNLSLEKQIIVSKEINNSIKNLLEVLKVEVISQESNFNRMVARKEIDPARMVVVNRLAGAMGARARVIETQATPKIASPVSSGGERQAKKEGIFSRLKKTAKKVGKVVGVGLTPDEKKAEEDVKSQKSEINNLENELKQVAIKGSSEEEKKKIQEKINLAKDKLKDLEAKKKEIIEKENAQEEPASEDYSKELDFIEGAGNIDNLGNILESMFRKKMIKEEIVTEFNEKIRVGFSDGRYDDVIKDSNKEIGIIGQARISPEKKAVLVKFYEKVIEIAERMEEKREGEENIVFKDGVEDFEKLNVLRGLWNGLVNKNKQKKVIEEISETIIGNLTNNNISVEKIKDLKIEELLEEIDWMISALVKKSEKPEPKVSRNEKPEPNSKEEYAKKLVSIFDKKISESVEKFNKNEIGGKEIYEFGKSINDMLNAPAAKIPEVARGYNELLSKIDNIIKANMAIAMLDYAKTDDRIDYEALNNAWKFTMKPEDKLSDFFEERDLDWLKSRGNKPENPEPKVEREFKKDDKVWVKIGKDNFIQRKVVSVSSEHDNVIIETDKKDVDQILSIKELAEWQEEHERDVKNKNNEWVEKFEKKIKDAESKIEMAIGKMSDEEIEKYGKIIKDNRDYIIKENNSFESLLSKEEFDGMFGMFGIKFEDVADINSARFVFFIEKKLKEKKEEDSKKPPKSDDGAGSEKKGDEGEKPESLYEEIVKDKTPMYIQTKIPKGAEYSGYKEDSSGVEGYYEWNINNWDKERPMLKNEAKENELLISKEGGNLIISFRKNYALDKRYTEKRTGLGWIAYRLPKEKTEKLWDGLKNNPSSAYDLIDPELLKLIGLSSSLEVVLEEEGKRLEVKEKSPDQKPPEKETELTRKIKELGGTKEGKILNVLSKLNKNDLEELKNIIYHKAGTMGATVIKQEMSTILKSNAAFEHGFRGRHVKLTQNEMLILGLATYSDVEKGIEFLESLEEGKKKKKEEQSASRPRVKV